MHSISTVEWVIYFCIDKLSIMVHGDNSFSFFLSAEVKHNYLWGYWWSQQQKAFSTKLKQYFIIRPRATFKCGLHVGVICWSVFTGLPWSDCRVLKLYCDSSRAYRMGENWQPLKKVLYVLSFSLPLSDRSPWDEREKQWKKRHRFPTWGSLCFYSLHPKSLQES